MKTVVNLLHRFNDALLRRVFKNAGILLSGQLVASLLGLAATALTARALGPELFGILVLVSTYALVVDRLVNFQSWQVIIKYGAEALENNRRDEFAALLKFGFLLDGGTAVLGTIMAACSVWFVGQWRGWSTEVVLMATIYSGTILFHVSGTPIAILRLFGRFKLFSVQTVVASAIKVVGVTGLYVVGGGLWAFLAVWALTDIVGKVMLILFGLRELRRRDFLRFHQKRLRGVQAMYPGLWRFALTTNLNSSIRIASREIDLFVIGALLSPAAVGLLKVAKQVASILSRVTDPLYQSIYPELAKLRAQRSTRKLTRLALRSSLLVGGLSFGGWLIIVIFGKVLLTRIFGTDYVTAQPILVWYMLAMVLAVFAFPLQPMMLAFGQPHRTLWVHLAATVVYFGLLFPLIEHTGLAGAGLAYLGYYVVWSTAMLMMLRSVLKRQRSIKTQF